MSKQTAVEWVLQKILIENGILNSDIEQAYKMEKEQIMDSFDTGRRKGDWIFDGEKYYEETYKKEEK
jgi:hypothetical protein